MSRKIQVLSQAVADQIAAGEVAERPSAVVKELVENAIDAGASKIEVEIKQGGVGYIRVTDNGSGIPAEQLETAFLRHATSKLSVIEDLETIGTMGFRGEALASICAVAEVEVISKTQDSEEGTYLELLHGVPGEKEPIACADGTTMVVKKLFANIPARMKFLKKDSTEAGYVSDLLGRIALSRPEIAFTYTCDGKEVFATSGDGKLENVILKLYGLDHAKAVIPVDHTEDHIRVSGFIGKPELARGNRTRQTLFVNGRYVKNHVLAKVAEEAYRNTIMVGRFPFFVLSVTLPSEQVDVNVHPAKTEIKFANEKQIYEVAYHALHSAVVGSQKPKTEETPKIEAKPAFYPDKKQEPMASPVKNFGVVKEAETSKPVGSGFSAYQYKAKEPTVTPTLVRQYLENTIPSREMEKSNTVILRDTEPENVLEQMIDDTPVQETMTEVVSHEESKREPFRIAGQVFDTYIVCQRGETMFLVDQHAAHERLRFESLKESYLKKEKLAQMLLSPMVINLDFNEKQTVMDHKGDFLDFGFEFDDFGGSSIIVHGTPIISDEQGIRDLILELAQGMMEQVKHPVADFEERALDMISCKYAIKANHKLTFVEMEDLVRRLEEMEEKGVSTCPHGRPIKIEFSKAEIEKMFKRRV